MVGRPAKSYVERQQRAIIILSHQRPFCVRVVPARTVCKGDVWTKGANCEVGERQPITTPRVAAALDSNGAAPVAGVDVGKKVVVASLRRHIIRVIPELCTAVSA